MQCSWHNAVRGTSYRHPGRLDGQWGISWTFCKRLRHLVEQWNAQVASWGPSWTWATGSKSTWRICLEQIVYEGNQAAGRYCTRLSRVSCVHGDWKLIVCIIRSLDCVAKELAFYLTARKGKLEYRVGVSSEILQIQER